MNEKIRVGILGVNATGGWAAMTHVPALKSLPEYSLTAVSNRTTEAAAAAGKAFDIPLTFDNNQQLIASEEVDLVTVTVRVPQHKELVSAAIAAGKDVYCEWPLGNGLEEAELLDKLAADKGIKGFVGLQSRAVPAISYVRDLIKEGYIGEVLSTSLIGSGIIFGAMMPQSFAYAVDAKNGAGMIYSTFGNAVDALCYTLGEFTELNATAINRRKVTTIIETNEEIPMTAWDQIAVNGILQSGAVASVHYRGGMVSGANFYWEINGSKGDLVITADGGSPAVFELTVKGLTIPQEISDLSLPAFNVAMNYKRVAKDIQEGTHLSATFHDAVIRHRMINAIEVAAKTGIRQSYKID
jgi:predicted dehydrogenase